MKLKLSYNLLVAMEHSLGDAPGLLADLKSALGGALGSPHEVRVVAMDDELVHRIDGAVGDLDKRSWLQPFFGPLTAAEIKQQWSAALDEARRNCSGVSSRI